MNFRRTRGTEGFTLIEVLVALSVVAVTLSAIGSLIAVTTRGARSVSGHLALVETARSIMTGLPGRDQLLPGNTWHGQVDQHRAGHLGVPQAVDRFCAVARDRHLKAFVLKEFAECGAGIGIVLDHQNRRRCVTHVDVPLLPAQRQN